MLVGFYKYETLITTLEEKGTNALEVAAQAP